MEAETAEKIDEILQNLTDLRSSVTAIQEHNSSIESRLDDIEAKVYEKPKINVRSEPSHVSFLNDCSTGITQGNSGQSSDINLDYFTFASPDDDLDIVDAQADFATIKEAVSKVKLPADLRLCDQKQGIKKDDQQTLQVLSKSARYVETSIKLLGTITPGKVLTPEEYRNLCTIQIAHVRYLQDENATLIVQNKFNKNTAQMFRSLQKNTSGLSPAHLKDLKPASKITASAAYASSSTTTSASTDVNWRDRRRGGYSYRGGFYNNRSYRGRGQVQGDVYSQYATRSVPPQQPS